MRKKDKKTTRQKLERVNGKLTYNMTNDYMFRAVLQTDKKVLAGIIGALLHVDPASLDVEIQNPIILGQSFENKDIILDINVLINNKSKINLEMQVVNYGNWKERSLSYLCRSFDTIDKGKDYICAKPVIQVSFVDFTLFPESPEFYATYMLKNIRNNRIYTDKLRLSIVELNNINLATEEDRLFELDKWAAFFKAKTWKELKSMAATNQYMEAAVNTIYELSSDETIREICRRREENEAYERYVKAEIERLKLANTNLSQEITNLSQANAAKDLEIARLKKQLADRQADTP